MSKIKNIVKRLIGFKDGTDYVEVSDANPLPVVADLEVSNIEIGAVEIKNKDTNDRLYVSPENAAKTRDISSMVDEYYDYVALTYVATGNGAGEIETVTYKSGGVGGTTVATLTIAYNADNEISSVTKT